MKKRKTNSSKPKKQRVSRKKKESGSIHYYLLFVLTIAAVTILYAQSNELSETDRKSYIQEKPAQNEAVSPWDMVEEQPEVEPLPEPEPEIVIEEEPEPVIEEVPEEPQMSDDERAIEECTTLCMRGETRDFVRKQCFAECDAVLRSSGREALDRVIAGLKK